MAERPNPGAPKTVSRVKRLGKYELLARIGVGGMAEVYLARQRGPMNFEKVVVVKTIHPHLASEKKSTTRRRPTCCSTRRASRR